MYINGKVIQGPLHDMFYSRDHQENSYTQWELGNRATLSTSVPPLFVSDWRLNTTQKENSIFLIIKKVPSNIIIIH